MIIVSQDKDLIVNFNNITVIGIAQSNSKEIDSITVEGEEQFLAEYKTEERAKEVLKEIARFYRMYYGMKYFKDSIKSGILEIVEEDGQDAFVYTMPEA